MNRLLALAVLVVGVSGSSVLLWLATHKRRPLDIAAALAAPLPLVLALLGAAALVIPNFFGK